MDSTELLELMGKCPVGELCDTYTTGFYYANVEDLLDSKTMVTVIGYDNPASNIALARLIAKLVNHAALFAELLAERESKAVDKYGWFSDAPLSGGVYQNHGEYVGQVWGVDGRWRWCMAGLIPNGAEPTLEAAKAAVEAAIRGAK